jgi:hypothetical protein
MGFAAEVLARLVQAGRVQLNHRRLSSVAHSDCGWVYLEGVVMQPGQSNDNHGITRSATDESAEASMSFVLHRASTTLNVLRDRGELGNQESHFDTLWNRLAAGLTIGKIIIATFPNGISEKAQTGFTAASAALNALRSADEASSAWSNRNPGRIVHSGSALGGALADAGQLAVDHLATGHRKEVATKVLQVLSGVLQVINQSSDRSVNHALAEAKNFWDSFYSVTTR